MSEGLDGFLDGLPISRHRPYARSSRLPSTTSVPLMRSVSRGSRSSEAASDHVRLSGNFVQDTSLLDVSGEQSIDTIRSSPGSVTSHPPLDHPSSTGQRRISDLDATFPLLNSVVADVSQAITSSVANCLKAGTLDETQMQIIVHTRLLNLLGSQGSSQELVRSQSSNRSAGRGGHITCDECDKSVARHCDMKYVHSRSNLILMPLIILQEA